jgi:hypothetical protein
MDFEAANKSRDRRLRRALLFTVHSARGSITGGIGGQTLLDVAQAGCADDRGFEDNDHAIQLIRDLENKGLAIVRIAGMRRHQRIQPMHLHVRITDKGSRLINETEPPDPDIDDERVIVEGG